MTRDELRSWIYEHYNVGARCDSLGPDLLDNILAWAGRYSDEEMRAFLGAMLPDDEDLQKLIECVTY